MAVQKMEGTVDRCGMVRSTAAGCIYAMKIGGSPAVVFSVPETWQVQFALLKPGDRVKIELRSSGNGWDLAHCLHNELSGPAELARELLKP